MPDPSPENSYNLSGDGIPNRSSLEPGESSDVNLEAVLVAATSEISGCIEELSKALRQHQEGRFQAQEEGDEIPTAEHLKNLVPRLRLCANALEVASGREDS